MLIDRTDINSLLTQANTLAAEAVVEADARETPRPPPQLKLPDSPEIRRLLRICVPVIVQLASRPMSIRTIRRFATGSIIEFHKSVEEELDLLVNNRPVGGGTCVKIGEHFGLRLTRVDDRAARIKSMGP